MYVTIFVILFLLSIFILLIGYKYEESQTILIGCMFIFLLGYGMLGGVEYKSGYTENSYTNISTNITTTTQTDEYTTYNTRQVSVWLMIYALITFILAILDLKAELKDWREG